LLIGAFLEEGILAVSLPTNSKAKRNTWCVFEQLEGLKCFLFLGETILESEKRKHNSFRFDSFVSQTARKATRAFDVAALKGARSKVPGISSNRVTPLMAAATPVAIRGNAWHRNPEGSNARRRSQGAS
jgi:hypothetical protein